MSFEFDFEKMQKRDPRDFEDFDDGFDDRDYDDEYGYDFEDEDTDIFGE